MAAVNLIGSYNYALVALSVLIAMFASYAALDLAGRVTATGGWTRSVWLLGGAGAMGTGIWSMHYIGMLAFILPIPVAYHWPTVLLSLFAAILASLVALGVVSRQKMGWFRALAGSVPMGAGIASMHYIGMAAMRLPAICQFNFFLVVLSVVFAVLISLAALWITFHFRDEKTGIGWEKLAGAVVMGGAIPVMHYTGMAAASFTPSGMPTDLSHAVSSSTLGTAGIAAATFIVLGLALLTSLVDRRFAAQTAEVQEEKLQQSEAYLAEAQRLSHTGSFGWKPSTNEIIWSEETFRIFQYDRSTTPTVELILQRVHPEDAALVKETIERASQNGKDFEHEYRLVMPDSSVKYVHVMAHALSHESGGVEFVGAVMDVSDRKRAEEELRRSEALAEQRLRLVVDTTPAMINSCRPDGYLDYVNKGWLDYFGFSLETALDRADVMKMSVPSKTDMHGGDWQPIIHPEDLQGFRDQWKATLASGKPGEHEARVRRFDGVYRWHLFRAVPLYDETRKPVKWYASAFDIEDRKRAEEALRRSEGYLGEAQRLTCTGSWAWNVASRRSIYWSQENYRLFGFDPEGGIPLDEAFYQRVHPEDRDRVRREVFLERPEEGSHFDVEFRIVLPDGAIKYLRSTGHPVRNISGDLLEYVGTSIDVTERKRADEERERLHQAQADLAHVNRVTTMGELTASLAHEVNQPIAAAITNANTCMRWLAADTPNLEEARAAAMRIVKDGTRAAEIIKRVRLLFKKGNLERELVDLNEVVRDMIVLLRSEATRYSISVRTKLAADLPEVVGDRVQLQQVLMNLMINSIDAMRDVNGTRELVVKSERGEYEQALVSVSDTGLGLPQQQADQIFNAFFTTKSHGTGMGLRISRSIVESHGGRLWAAENSPRGASFYVTLPTKAEALE
ncbi:MAG TPA: MHYT domain-containing protein [Candidatus Polarisedimenticolia bacterium]|nr:MHYT domain-containing protein [Candidatus Polarisedimenticolia bacterium]